MYWAAISAGYALQLSHGAAQPVGEELGWRIGYGSFATVGAIIVSRATLAGSCAPSASQARWPASSRTMPPSRFFAGRSGCPVGSRWLAGSWPWYIAFGLILTLLLLPDGRLPSRRRRPVAWLSAAPIVLLCGPIAILYWPLRGPALVAPGDFGQPTPDARAVLSR